MMVLFPFSKQNYSALLDLLDWIADLDKDNLCHNALLVAGKGVDKGEIMGAIEAAERTFGSVSAVQCTAGTDEKALFQSGSDYMRTEACVPFLWCPTDLVPVKPRWLDELDKVAPDQSAVRVHAGPGGLYLPDGAMYHIEQTLLTTSEDIRAIRKRLGKQKQDANNCFIQLGRYGDLMIVLRALKIIHDQTGEKPKLIVSNHYLSLLDGVSYVTPFSITTDWWNGIPEAIRFAERTFGGGTVLQCHGREWGVQIPRWRSFEESMWDRSGVPLNMLRDAPLVFDRRNPQREAVLVAKHANAKPMLLINFTGVSSPFPHTQAVMRELRHFADKFNVVDLGRIRAERIYDLLGLYDVAAGVVTIDTATLHLCAGSKVKNISFLVGGWNCSTPAGNCILSMTYQDVPKRYPQIVGALHDMLKTSLQPA